MQSVMVRRGNTPPLDTPFRINRSSQQSVGLVFWAPLITPVPWDYVGNRPLNILGSPSYKVIEGRPCWQFSTGNGLYIDSTLVTAAPLSLASWGYGTDDASQMVTVSIGDTGADTDWFDLKWAGNVAGDPIRADAVNAGTATAANTAVGFVINRWIQAAGVFASGSSRSAYLDGGSKGTAGGARVPAGVDRIGIGHRATITPALHFTGYLSDVRIYNRALSDNEVWQLYDPATRWELYEPTTPIWVVGKVPGAAAYTLTAAQASFTLSGQAATLKADRRLTAAQASFTETGQAANLRFGHKLTAAQATVTLTGQSANLRFGHKLTAAQGTFTLSGQAAALQAARRLTAAQASFALTGQAANLVYTPAGAYTLIAAQASFTLIGQSAILRTARLLSAATSAFVLTGQAANLVYTPTGAYTLIAAQGSFILSGQSAGLLAGRRLSAAQASYTLSGQNVVLRVARALLAGQAAYTLTGYSAILTWSGSVIPVTPLERIYAILAENRVFAIDVEYRVIAVDRESRIFSIDAENRVVAVDRESRIYAVPEE